MWADDQRTVRKKTLSTGAELAGTARILSNKKYPRGTNPIAQTPGRRCKA